MVCVADMHHDLVRRVSSVETFLTYKKKDVTLLLCNVDWVILAMHFGVKLHDAFIKWGQTAHLQW